jgi:hypothetical protein
VAVGAPGEPDPGKEEEGHSERYAELHPGEEVDGGRIGKDRRKLGYSTSLSLRIIMLLAEPWNLTKTKDLYRLQAPSYVFDQKDKGHLQKE